MVRLTGRSGQGSARVGVLPDDETPGTRWRDPGGPETKETDMGTLTTWLKAVDNYTLWAFNPHPTRRSR